MVLKFNRKVLLIVFFYAIEFLKLYKALKLFITCLLVSNNLYGKLFSSLELPTTVDEIFKVTSIPFFIPNFYLSSCKLDNFTFKVLH